MRRFTYSGSHQEAIVQDSGLSWQQLVAVLQPLLPSVHPKVPLLAAGVHFSQLPERGEVRCKQGEGTQANQVL